MAFGFENVQLRQLNERKGSDGMKKKLSVKRIFLISLAVFLVGLMQDGNETPVRDDG